MLVERAEKLEVIYLLIAKKKKISVAIEAAVCCLYTTWVQCYCQIEKKIKIILLVWINLKQLVLDFFFLSEECFHVSGWDRQTSGALNAWY